MEASGAAAKALALLAEARGTEVREKEYPPERDVDGRGAAHRRLRLPLRHQHRRGGRRRGGGRSTRRSCPSVVHAETNLYTCSEDTQRNIAAKIQEHGLNRVIVSSCTPRTHEPLFQETMREAGLNPYLFEMANIRDQCSWVHRNDKPAATKKAKDLVRMAAGPVRTPGAAAEGVAGRDQAGRWSSAAASPA